MPARKGKCAEWQAWAHRTSFTVTIASLAGMSLILEQVLKEPIVVTQKFKTGFNILFLLFVIPMCGLTLTVMTDYAKHKKLCRCRIFTYIVLTIVILTVSLLEGKMLYKARLEMKTDL